MPGKDHHAALSSLLRQRSLGVALLLWVLLNAAVLALCHGSMPLPIGPHPQGPVSVVVYNSTALAVLTLEIGLIAVITRKRTVPDMAERAPERRVAIQEVTALWIYGAAVLFFGRFLGLRLFGEGIAMHLNGSLVGATRLQLPRELYTWAAYNFVLLALVPYLVFRARGYTNHQLNLKSENVKSDTLVILVVLAIGCFLDIVVGKNFLDLTPHQQLVGGTLSFFFHLAGTDLPIMIFIYALLMPRYARLASGAMAFLLGAASYPAMHVFESWTRYDSLAHGTLSVLVVFLFFFPPGVMKSFLTLRTGNAWVHLWGFHAITPHVTVDTKLIVDDFHLR